MLLPTDECRSTVKSYLRSILLLGLFLFTANAVKGQSVNVTSPAASPSTYGVGTPISLSANPDPGFLGTVTGVSYSLPPLGSLPGTGATYAASFTTSTLAFGTYTLTATLTYSTAIVLANTRTQTITINIVPASPTATAPATCIGSPAVITVSGGLPAGGTYNLYTAATGGTLLATSTTGPFTTPVITATTTYYVSYISGGFESLRTPVTITASTSPAKPVFTATSTVATGTNATITLTPVAGLTYSWDFSGGTPATGTGTGPFSVSWATAGAKLITVTATNAGGCTSTATQTVTVTKTISSGNYAFSQPITLNETGAGMVGAVNNFPVLVYIKEDALKSGVNCATNVKFPTGGTNGYDFAFTTVGGTNELFYQVESFDASTGTLLAWVQVPVLSTTTTNLTFYFGSLTPAHNTSFGNATWPTDYQAVYHFSEAAAAGSTTADATANLHTGTTSNLTAASNVTGIIGSNAYTFNGTNTRVAANAVNISSSFTLSAWIKLNATGIDQKIMTNQIATGSASGGYKLGVYTDNTIEAESPQVNRTSTPAAPAFTTTGWHYVQGVFNTTDNTLRTYVDGIAYKVLTGATTLPSSLNPLYIGVGEGGFTLWFSGIIDEARISNNAKTSDWIKAEYFNQNNYLTFTNSTGTIVGNVANAAAIGGSIVYTWTGTTSTNVSVAGNWRTAASGNPVASAAPPVDGTASLNIPNVTNKPVLTANGAYYGVTIASGSSLNLGTFTLTVGCNVYNSGTMNTAAAANTSTITWNGTFTPQLYTGTNTANTAQFGSFIVNNTAASGIVRITGGPLDVYNTITLAAGSLDVNNAGNGALTLKSSSTVTAGVAQIPTGLSITGTVVVERWFKGGAINNRSYRLMTSPVNNSGNIPMTVSSAFNFSSLKTNLLFTGTGGSANGFDDSPTNGPTVLFYNTLADNYTRLASITSTRPVGSGFYFYFRGDNINNISNKSARVGGVYATPEANVVGLQSGTLNQGSLTFALTSGGFGYNMAGNPYPSSISLPASALTNTAPFIYTYNPAGTSIITQTPPFVLGSGQGFYVRTVAAAATIAFAESYKTTTQPTILAFNQLDDPEGNITLQMIQDSANYDFARLRFADKYKPAYYNLEDADDLNGSGQVVFFGAMTSDKHLVAIGSQPIDKKVTSVFLSVDDNASGLFAIKRTDLSNIPKAYDVWLMDHFKKDSLDLRVHDSYNFNIDKANAATFGNNRFEIIIRKKSLPPYQLLSFAGNKSIAAVTLDWNTLNEYDYTTFELQKSTDGKTFETIQQLPSTSSGSYSYKDFNLSTTEVYYRLKQTDINDVVTYSKVIVISVKGGGTLSIFPNPASNTIQFSLDQQVNTGIHLRIFNATGVQVKSNDFNSSTGQQDISSLKPGAYTIELVDNASKKTLLTGKFIKVE